MRCPPTIFLILAVCLGVLAPAQAAGNLQGNGQCVHLAGVALNSDGAQATDDAGGAIGGAPCHMACAAIGASTATARTAIGCDRPALAERVFAGERPGGIDRPPRS